MHHNAALSGRNAQALRRALCALRAAQYAAARVLRAARLLCLCLRCAQIRCAHDTKRPHPSLPHPPFPIAHPIPRRSPRRPSRSSRRSRRCPRSGSTSTAPSRRRRRTTTRSRASSSERACSLFLLEGAAAGGGGGGGGGQARGARVCPHWRRAGEPRVCPSTTPLTPPPLTTPQQQITRAQQQQERRRPPLRGRPLRRLRQGDQRLHPRGAPVHGPSPDLGVRHGRVVLPPQPEDGRQGAIADCVDWTETGLA